jgi:Flp pilus assembly protein protease CpaA
MLFLCFTDIVYYTIPNWVVLPAIIVGGILTGYWLPAIIMFGIGALLFNRNKLCGGDVKLMAMAGAFLGVKGLFAFILSRIFVWLYRIIKKETGMLPYAPFIAGASLLFIWL